MANVTLKNPRDHVFLFTLYHDVYCKEGSCDCNKQHVIRKFPGGLKYVDIVNPKSVHLEGGQAINLDSNVLKIQQVDTALKTGRLQQVKVEVHSDTKESK
jgi:hypothetical protein